MPYAATKLSVPLCQLYGQVSSRVDAATIDNPFQVMVVVTPAIHHVNK